MHCQGCGGFEGKLVGLLPKGVPHKHSPPTEGDLRVVTYIDGYSADIVGRYWGVTKGP